MIHLDTNSPGLDNNPAYNLNALEQPCSEDPLSNEIIRYPVTVGRSVRHPESIAVRDIAYVMEAIKNGSYEGYNLKRSIEVLRNMTDKEAQKNAKSTLPWFSGSLIRKSRSNLNVEKAQFQIFDLDHVPNPEQLKELAIGKLPCIRYAFRSVLDGIKLIAQFTKPITSEHTYRVIYTFMALQLEWALKHICDTTSDWSRACFMSYDPCLLINPNCHPLDPLVTYKQAVSVMEIPFPGGSASPGTDILSVHADGTSAVTAQSDYAKVGTDILSVHADGTSAATAQSDYAKAQAVITTMSKIPIVYKDWIKVGQAIYAGFGEQGKALWDMFLNNPHYNDSQCMLDAHWRSFKSVHSIKLGSLFYVAEQYGVKYE